MSKKTTKAPKDLPLWLWLGLPLFLWLTPYVLKEIDESLFVKIAKGEMGMLENFTVLALVILIFVGVALFKELIKYKHSWFKYWILLLMLASFYFAGEEASWGQHYFQWATPEWMDFNVQHETNIHNTNNPLLKKLVNKLPRLVLEIMAFVGGIIIPILVRLIKPRWYDAKKVWYWLTPTMACVPTSLLAIFVGVPIRLMYWSEYTSIKHAGLPTPDFFRTHTTESKECFLALFLMIYVTSIYSRWRTANK